MNIRIAQEKFATVMKDNANLVEKLKDIEHQNIILEGETDTIGKNYLSFSVPLNLLSVAGMRDIVSENGLIVTVRQRNAC
jgi:hypothetical protein